MGNMKTKRRNRPKRSEHPFRSAVLRGLGIVVPPLLTIVIFLWVASTVNQYVLRPLTAGSRNALVWSLADIRHDVPDEKIARRMPRTDELAYYYYPLQDDEYIPWDVYDTVRKDPGAAEVPQTGEAVYRRYVDLTYLQPHKVIPAFLAAFILVLYLLGKFMAAGIGRIFVNIFERGILQLPLVRSVYSSVKQVSDFLFSQREVEYTRVVAVEYPRKGIWSLGMVTGESLLDIRSEADEPVLSVLIPTSPMPVTGYTINVRKSETIDLNITVDQAFQFVVSCGVVIPPQQLQEAIEQASDDDED